MNEFKDYKLSEVGKWLGGGTPSKSNQLYWKNGSIPWVSPKDMKSLYIEKTQDYLTEKAIEESTAKIIPENSILIVTRSGILQHDVPIAVNKVPVTINQDLKAIIPNGKIKSNYLAHVLRLEKNRILHECAKVGTTVESLGTNLLKGFNIEAPSLNIQEEILSLLSEWDNKSTTIKKLIRVKKRYKKGLMQQLLSGKKRFPEFEGEEWQEVKIGHIVKEVGRDVNWDDSALYDLISIKRRSEGIVHRESLHGHEIKTKNLKTVKKDDFIISRMQVLHGASALASEEFEGTKVSGSYHTLVARNSNKFSIKYFNYLSRTPYLYHLAYISSHGVHIEKMTFKIDDYLKKKIKVPPSKAEQDKIVKVLDVADKEISLLKKELEAIKKQKKGLMQQLLTGKVRVNHKEADYAV